MSSRENPDPGALIRGYLTATTLWGVQTATALGLSVAEYATLMSLHLHGPISAGQLVGTTRLSPAAISRLVDRLVERGFVRREPDAQDGRRALIALTDTWQAEIDQVVEPHRASSRQVFAQLSTEERAAVLRWMQLATEGTLAILDAAQQPDPD